MALPPPIAPPAYRNNRQDLAHAILDFRKILAPALAALPSDRSAYFAAIAQTILEDARYETDVRLMFVVLAACLADLF